MAPAFAGATLVYRRGDVGLSRVDSSSPGFGVGSSCNAIVGDAAGMT
jgi:hypothetical protein